MRVLIFVFLISFGTLINAQEPLKILGQIPVNGIDDFTVDQFDNVYVVNDAELKKYDNKGKELASFSELILGDIYQVDARNALTPYVFYRDVNQLVMVDNRLNMKSQISFNDYGFVDVRFISFSDQSNVWLYDQATDKIYRFNPQSREATNKSLSITPIIGEENEPVGMLSTLNHVYLNVPSKGLFVFDAVGSFQELIPLAGLKSFDVYKQYIYAVRQDGGVVMYDSKTGEKRELLNPSEVLVKLSVSADRIYVLSENLLGIYSRK